MGVVLPEPTPARAIAQRESRNCCTRPSGVRYIDARSVSSLSDDVITAVPQSLRDGSYGLGATKSETIRQGVIPAALPGIAGGLLLATGLLGFAALRRRKGHKAA